MQDINTQREIKQDDILALFLFLLVFEDVSGLFRRVVDLGLFFGFKMGTSCPVVSHL